MNIPYNDDIIKNETDITLAKKYLDKINSKFTEEQIKNSPQLRVLYKFLGSRIKYREAEIKELNQLNKIVKIKQFKYSKEYQNMGIFLKLFNNIGNYFKLWREERTFKSLEARTERSGKILDFFIKKVSEKVSIDFVSLFNKIHQFFFINAKGKFDKELQEIFDKIILKEKIKVINNTKSQVASREEQMLGIDDLRSEKFSPNLETIEEEDELYIDPAIIELIYRRELMELKDSDRKISELELNTLTFKVRRQGELSRNLSISTNSLDSFISVAESISSYS